LVLDQGENVSLPRGPNRQYKQEQRKKENTTKHNSFNKLQTNVKIDYDIGRGGGGGGVEPLYLWI
jgi:hypothetical protein